MARSLVLETIGTELMLRKNIDSRKLRYFGHVSRKDGSVEKLITQGKVEGSRRRGRPATSWTDDTKKNSGLSMTAVTRLAEGRSNWRALVMAKVLNAGVI